MEEKKGETVQKLLRWYDPSSSLAELSLECGCTDVLGFSDPCSDYGTRKRQCMQPHGSPTKKILIFSPPSQDPSPTDEFPATSLPQMPEKIAGTVPPPLSPNFSNPDSSETWYSLPSSVKEKIWATDSPEEEARFLKKHFTIVSCAAKTKQDDENNNKNIAGTPPPPLSPNFSNPDFSETWYSPPSSVKENIWATVSPEEEARFLKTHFTIVASAAKTKQDDESSDKAAAAIISRDDALLKKVGSRLEVEMKCLCGLHYKFSAID